MREVDYLIIGQGIGGTAVARQAMLLNKSFLIVDDNEENSSSKVAAGIINPVTGARVVKTWLADALFPYAEKFYTSFQQELNTEFIHFKNLYKPYRDIIEQNDIQAKSQNDSLSAYLFADQKLPSYEGVVNDVFGACQIKHGGYLDTEKYLTATRNYFLNNNQLLEAPFNASDVTISSQGVEWKGVKAKKLILAQGYRATKCPYFSWLPIVPTKGEILEIEHDQLPTSHIVNKGGFILPIGGNSFLAGATYDKTDDKSVSEKGKKALFEKLDKILLTPYKLKGVRAGIRPASLDRRPLIGKHPDHDAVYVFNGLGAKGVTLSAYFSEQFIRFIENNEELMPEVNITRYNSLYIRC